jgi:acyl-coenzyme A thioesterase PaaI-like protein
MNRKETLLVRAWALKNVFLLWFVKPRVMHVDDDRCEIVIPLNWRTRNHLGSMYFGALCIGADLAGGLIAFSLMRKQKARVSFVFKDIRGEFLKRPDADVHFHCADGPAIRALLQRTLESGEREETPVHVRAVVGEEEVARFELTLSLKRK